ncbi:MAG TPA: site-specific integrase [Saprospiraceae bacterium]|nr:site-specific integrase [Saprospiraceae bacterium]
MISVKIVLDERTKKKDGRSPLKLRIVHNRKTYHITLDKNLLACDWDDNNQRVKSNCKDIQNTTRFNAILNGRKQEVYDLLVKLQDEGHLNDMPFSKIRSFLTRSSDELLLLEFGEEIIKEFVQSRRIGNARVYRTLLSSLSTFLKKKDVSILHVNYSFVKKYEAWYLGKGNSLNGLSVHLRTLRAVINRAIKEKRLPQDHNPFSEYRIKNEKTKKRAIKTDALQAIRDFEPLTERQKRAKQFFMFSFLTIGASFVDIVMLRLSDIVDGRIHYKRRKTGRLHNVPVTPALQRIIDEVTINKQTGDYIFNVVKSEDPIRQSIEIRDELRRYNRTLKEIGQVCGIAIPLSSYVSRHSYATIAKNKGVPVEVISEVLGHTNIATTMIYLDEFEQAAKDKFHDLVIELRS